MVSSIIEKGIHKNSLKKEGKMAVVGTQNNVCNKKISVNTNSDLRRVPSTFLPGIKEVRTVE